MTNPLKNLRTYIDLRNPVTVGKWGDDCEKNGIYLDELIANVDSGVIVYDCHGELLHINQNAIGGLSLTLENQSHTGTIEQLEDLLLSWAIDEGYAVPGFAPEAPNGCPIAITSHCDMLDFLMWLFISQRVAYHWDEMASQYVDESGERLWSPQVAKHVDNMTAAALEYDSTFFQKNCIDFQRKCLPT